MKTGFIGAGRVAAAVGGYLRQNNIEVSGFYSRSIDSARAAASFAKSRPYEYIEPLVEETDAVIITTPDDVIPSIAQRLSNLNTDWGKKIVCHMSGAYSSDILSCLGDRGATVCSLHPMLSFGERSSSVEALKNTFFTLEGKGEKLNCVKQMISKLGNPLVEISPDSKTLYHLAACMVSNYLVTILDTGIQMLKRAGFSEIKARELIGPLVRKTVDNTLEEGSEKSLTGPLSRGDTMTVKKHLHKLHEDGNEEWTDVYKVLAQHTLTLARRGNRIDSRTEADIKGVIDSYGK